MRELHLNEVHLPLEQLRLERHYGLLAPTAKVQRLVEPYIVILQIFFLESSLRFAEEMENCETKHLQVVSPALVAAFVRPS